MLAVLAGVSAWEVCHFVFWRKQWFLDSSGKPVEIDGGSQAINEWWYFATDPLKLGMFAAIIFVLPLIVKACIEAVDIGEQWETQIQFYVFTVQAVVISTAAGMICPLWLVSSSSFQDQVSVMPFVYTDTVIDFFQEKIPIPVRIFLVHIGFLFLLGFAWLLVVVILKFVMPDGMLSGGDWLVLSLSSSSYAFLFTAVSLASSRVYWFVRLQSENYLQ